MSTLHVGEQTDPRVLLQPSALELASADNSGVGTKRGASAGPKGSAPGMQHGREETTALAPEGSGDTGSSTRHEPAGGVTPATRQYRPAPQPRVFVLDRRGEPLEPCRPDRARKLLKSGRARVARMRPFTIRIVDREAADSVVAGVQIGVDPGSRTTGIAVFTETTEGEVSTRDGVLLIELSHRGGAIRKKLSQRSAHRKRRRSSNLRYRAPRFRNRRPSPCAGCGKNSQSGSRWCRPCKALPRDQRCASGTRRALPPSLQHRVDTTAGWIARLARIAPVARVHVERARFDTHLLARPDVSGAGYQYGALQGFEVREYVLMKWGRACVYCGVMDVPVNLDHVRPKARGGSDRPSNLVPSCVPCNQVKGKQSITDFLARDPRKLAMIQRGQKAPLRDASVMNATRYATVDAIRNLDLSVTTATGGRTKYNRVTCGVSKTHALDALCVGQLGAVGSWPAQTLAVGCTGRGSHARTRTDRYGFPRLRLTRVKAHFGFITGDRVRAVVPTGKNAGTHVGRVSVRATGSFNITTTSGTVQGISHRYLTLLTRGDGYSYQDTSTPERRESR